jgi:hypothetical protein
MFKQITAADLRKLEAQSNDSDSGGGARDFRFSPYKQFESFVKRLFPNVQVAKRRRDGVPTDVEIRSAKLLWYENGTSQKTGTLSWEPPTDARPFEGRIPRVHQIAPLGPDYLPPANEGESFVLLTQDEDGIWVHYVSETELRQTGPAAWSPAVAKPILTALAKVKKNDLVRGWIDIETGQDFVAYD